MHVLTHTPAGGGADNQHHHGHDRKSIHFHFMFGGRECGLKAETVEDKEVTRARAAASSTMQY